MTPQEFDNLIVKMDQLLSSPAVADCPNRSGLRRQSADWLEAAYLEVAAAMKPDLSIEIGAHEASYSLRLGKAIPGLQRIAFEANPHVHAKYSEELTAAGVDYRNLAICEAEGPIDLFIPREWSDGQLSNTNAISSMLPRKNATFTYDMVTIEGLPLDVVLKDTDYDCAVAWIDVEGAQRQILHGAKSFLPRAAAIHIELETAEVWQGQEAADDIAKALESLGFRSIMRDNIARVQFNQVFLRDTPANLKLAAPAVQSFVANLEAAIG